MTVINGDGLVGRVKSVTGHDRDGAARRSTPSDRSACGSRARRARLLNGTGDCAPCRLSCSTRSRRRRSATGSSPSACSGDSRTSRASRSARSPGPGTPGRLDPRRDGRRRSSTSTSLDLVGVVVEPPRTDPRDAVLPPKPTPSPTPAARARRRATSKPLERAVVGDRAGGRRPWLLVGVARRRRGAASWSWSRLPLPGADARPAPRHRGRRSGSPAGPRARRGRRLRRRPAARPRAARPTACSGSSAAGPGPGRLLRRAARGRAGPVAVVPVARRRAARRRRPSWRTRLGGSCHDPRVAWEPRGHCAAHAGAVRRVLAAVRRPAVAALWRRVEPPASAYELGRLRR